MGNFEEQEEEITVLQSIFEDESIFTIQKGEVPRGILNIHVLLPESFHVVSETVCSKEQKTRVQYLPPMKLYFKLVHTYPSSTCPEFLITCQWLTMEQLRKLCQQMDRIWEECKPEVVLYRWMTFLQEESLQFLEIHETLDISPLKSYSSGPIDVQFSPPQKRKETPINSRSPQKSNHEKSDTSRFYSSSYYRQQPQRNVRRLTTKSTVKSDQNHSKPVHDMSEKKTSEQIQKNKEKAIEHLRKKSGVIRCCVQTTNTHDDPKCDSRAVVQLNDGFELLSKLIDYNEKRKQREFEKQWFACKVCLVDKQGCQGLRFHGCDHIYCKECMRSFFMVQIKEGNVQGLTCPEEKCTSQALPYQVSELVGDDLYTRYDKLLLDSSLAQMNDITTCPLKSCQCFVIVEPESTMASCPSCKFNFCVFCRKTYHGLDPCRFQAEEKKSIRKTYLEGSHEEKLKLEKRYGKKEIQAMINESMSEEWVQRNSKKCPHCSAAIEKSDGCNKMVCWRCNTFFCWLCNRRLSPDTPYLHYNDPKSPCFNNLFQGMEEPEEEDDDWRVGEFLP